MFGSDWENILQMNQLESDQQLKMLNSPLLYHQATVLNNDIESDNNLAGIIPRTIHYLYKCHDASLENNKVQIYASFMQIYNEKIYDLLQEQMHPKPLSIHESKFEGIFVGSYLYFYLNITTHNI